MKASPGEAEVNVESRSDKAAPHPEQHGFVSLIASLYLRATLQNLFEDTKINQFFAKTEIGIDSENQHKHSRSGGVGLQPPGQLSHVITEDWTTGGVSQLA